ncbi:MAG: ASCH domain-containing protein [Candidatus Woesearchaeota archaeon]
MKRLKFSKPLPEMVLSGTETTTWRINDDKNLSVGDEFKLCHTDGKEFAAAIITKIRETTFKNLTEDDKSGHEKFSSEKNMYRVYSKYYNINVTPQTPVKVVKFRVL